MKKVCVIIPCFNEEQTITKVIKDFQRELPNTRIVVIDNASTDKTAETAKQAGAEIIPCHKKGKGAAMRKAFHSLEADFFVMVDGDDTYPAESVHAMLAAASNGADMVVGDRISNGNYQKENKRAMHNLGNHLVRSAINLLFRTNLKDVLSGYRVLSNKFAKNCPILLNGFEIESEMTIHAVEKLFEIQEIPVQYRDRPPGSKSKLNTIKDGISVLRAILWIFKDSKPLIFFGTTSLITFILSLAIYLKELPLISLALFTLACTLCACGLILDTLAKYQRESFEIQMLHKKNL